MAILVERLIFAVGEVALVGFTGKVIVLSVLCSTEKNEQNVLP